jgi:hypothetical protein
MQLCVPQVMRDFTLGLLLALDQDLLVPILGTMLGKIGPTRAKMRQLLRLASVLPAASPRNPPAC